MGVSPKNNKIHFWIMGKFFGKKENNFNKYNNKNDLLSDNEINNKKYLKS